MKINEITESKQQLDEAIFTGAAALTLGGLAVAGAGITGYEIYQNWQAFKSGEITKKELAARVGGDVALGLIGGGIGGAIKVLRGAWKGTKALKTVNKAGLKDAKKQVKNAAEELKTAKQLEKGTSGADAQVATTLKKGAAKDLDAAKAKVGDLKLKRAALKDKYKWKATGTGVGLAVPDEYDPLRDPTYKAFGGKGSKQPAPGTGMPDVSSAEPKPKPAPKPKPEEKPAPTVLQRWKWGKGGKNFPGMNK